MKTIWITGGSAGIGAATAKKFNQEIWRVIIRSRNIDKLHKNKEIIKNNSNNKDIHAIQCDISNMMKSIKS